MMSKIKNIEYIGERKTVDIEVEDEHCFWANGIYTHNSGSISSDPNMTDIAECILSSEKVKLLNGCEKRIDQLNIGDKITSNDNYKTVTMIHEKRKKDCIKITLKSGKTIIVSKKHKFPTNKGRLSYDSGLVVGDKLNSKNNIINFIGEKIK